MVSRPHKYPGRNPGSADQRAAGLTDPVGAAARGFCHQREQSLDGVEGLAGDAVPTVEDVVRASVAGDRIANFILAETGKFLGIGIVNLVNLLNPELVMPGGEVGGSRSSPARSHLRRRRPRIPPVSARAAMATQVDGSGTGPSSLMKLPLMIWYPVPRKLLASSPLKKLMLLSCDWVSSLPA